MFKKGLGGIFSSAVRAAAACVCAAVCWVGPAGAESLSLADYLRQVEEKNSGLAAARAGLRAGRAGRAERDLLTSPFAFASFQTGRDTSRQVDPALGTDRAQRQLEVGVEEQTNFGLTARLSHQTVFTDVNGASPLYLPLAEFYQSQTGISLRQDLWRNAFGREIQSAQKVLEATAEAEALGKAYQALQLLVQAEIAYWRAGFNQEKLKIQDDLLERARRLEAWTANRVALKLTDRSDWLQAQAQVKVLELERASSADEGREAARAVNVLRGLDSDEIPEVGWSGNQTLEFPVLSEEAPERLDIRALAQTREAAEGEAARKQSALLPQASLQAQVALNGLDAEARPALADSLGPAQYSYGAGVQVRIPLDFGVRGDLSAGYALSAEAAEKNLVQRRLEAGADWRELRRRLEETRGRLQLARDLEQSQRLKAEYERASLRQGNTVTYQVLQFEQDWGRSRLALAGVEMTLRELLARLKLFAEN